MRVCWPKRGGAMLAIDPNLIDRYLTVDHPTQSSARALIDSHAEFRTATATKPGFSASDGRDR
ncbi:hypothetical protein MES5069_30247 [Mesorhizobium escarrei]|uniref:Uncharacterized protein n=1 Tax=Mesorhizobium escarrei TaxID=666018 RepID=A0ABM9E046_9HYPH|nr:hypothetical protein MES5069_30247 [Mesorhizobium escarrei]